jgi:hypothetical protein
MSTSILQKPGGSNGCTMIDDLMPEYHNRIFRSVEINCPCDQVYHTLQEISMDDFPFFRWLMSLRANANGAVEPPDGPVFGMLNQDLPEARIEEEPGCELVQVLMGRFWKEGGGYTPIPDREAFENAPPDVVKTVASYRFERIRGNGRTRFCLETRVRSPLDPEAARHFWRYWRVQGFAGSACFTHALVHAVKRRAEAQSN